MRKLFLPTSAILCLALVSCADVKGSGSEKASEGSAGNGLILKSGEAVSPEAKWLEMGYVNFNHNLLFHNNNLYRVGGHGAGMSVFRYPVKDGVPDVKAVCEKSRIPISGDNIFSPTAVLSENRIYLMGGRVSRKGEKDTTNGKVFFAEINADGSLSDWKETAPLPDDSTSGGMGVAVKDKIYYVGGYMKRRFFMATIKPDGLLSEWKECKPLTSTACGGGLCELNGYLYVNGSPQHATGSEKVFFTKIGNDGTPAKWRRATNLPIQGMGRLLSSKSSLLYFDGMSGKIYQTTGFEDNGQVADWKEIADMPVRGAGGYTITRMADGVYFYMGGIIGSKQPYIFPKSTIINIKEDK